MSYTSLEFSSAYWGIFLKTDLVVLFAEDLSVEGVVGSLYDLLTYRANLLNVLQKVKNRCN
jgi:hypothetical protein